MDLTKEHEQFGGEWYDFLTAIIIITSIILIKPIIYQNINKFNEGFINPATFTLAMKNLP